MPGTSSSVKELVKIVKQIDEQYNVLNMLSSINVVVAKRDEITGTDFGEDGYSVLILNFKEQITEILSFKKTDFQKANETYAKYESLKNEYTDVVLVRAATIKDIEAGFPNYFMDIREFVNIIKNYLNGN